MVEKFIRKYAKKSYFYDQMEFSKGSKLYNFDEVEKVAKELAEQLVPGSVVAFFGELGSGKTTLIKEMVAALTSLKSSEVTSPTFVYLHIYEGKLPVYHFDLYRLHNADEFFLMGFHEYFDQQGVCLIEWSERIEELLPEKTIKIALSYCGEGARELKIL